MGVEEISSHTDRERWVPYLNNQLPHFECQCKSSISPHFQPFQVCLHTELTSRTVQWSPKANKLQSDYSKVLHQILVNHDPLC